MLSEFYCKYTIWWVYEIFKSLQSVLISILRSITTFLELSLYFICVIYERVSTCLYLCQMCVCVPLQVLPGADSEGAPIASRPQQQVSSFGFSLKKQLGLQAGDIVVTAIGMTQMCHSSAAELGI